MLHKIICKLNKILKDRKKGIISHKEAFRKIQAVEVPADLPIDDWKAAMNKHNLALAILYKADYVSRGRRYSHALEISKMYYDNATDIYGKAA